MGGGLMQIGTFGPVVFEVSSEKVRTFDSLQRTESGRWTTHEVLHQKPKSEFLGADNGSITFDMYFNVALNVHPQKEIDMLIRMVRVGAVHTLIIGEKRHGIHKWKITSVGQTYNKWDNRGNVLTASVSVSLEEYV